MKTIIQILMSIMLIPNLAFGSVTTYEIDYRTQVDDINFIKSQGVQSRVIIPRSDGWRIRYTIVGFRDSADGTKLIVELAHADKSYRVHPDGSYELVIPYPDNIKKSHASDPSASKSANSGKGEDLSQRETRMSGGSSDSHAPKEGDKLQFGGGDTSVGVADGVVTAVHYAIVKDMGFIEDIEEAQRNIKIYSDKIRQYGAEIAQAEYNVKTKAYDLKIKGDITQKKVDTLLDGFELDGNIDVRAFVPVDVSKVDLEKYEWRSQDPKFRSKADAVRVVLANHKLSDGIERSFFGISKSALFEADQQSALGNKAEADFLLDIAKQSADVLVGWDPFTGTGRSIYETLTGQNIITGEPLSDGERVIAALGIFTAGYALKAHRIFRVLKPIAQKAGKGMTKSYAAIQRFLNKTGNGFTLGRGSEMRRVKFRYHADPKAGLNPVHLNKHFFGQSRFALTKIDPKGTPDKWMAEMMNLMQKSPTKVHPDGALDIFDYYQNADKSGYYQVGIRLKPNNDGAYDFITLLTDQRR